MRIRNDEIDGINLSSEKRRISELLSFADSDEFDSMEVFAKVTECVVILNNIVFAINKSAKDKLETVRIKS